VHPSANQSAKRLRKTKELCWSSAQHGLTA
jgi:hypothetical protein